MDFKEYLLRSEMNHVVRTLVRPHSVPLMDRNYLAAKVLLASRTRRNSPCQGWIYRPPTMRCVCIPEVGGFGAVTHTAIRYTLCPPFFQTLATGSRNFTPAPNDAASKLHPGPEGHVVQKAMLEKDLLLEVSNMKVCKLGRWWAVKAVGVKFH